MKAWQNKGEVFQKNYKFEGSHGMQHPRVDFEQPPVVAILSVNQHTLQRCSKLPVNLEQAKKITQPIAYFISEDQRQRCRRQLSVYDTHK